MAELLRQKGAVVVDADVVARAVVEPGQPRSPRWSERFGTEILDPDGHLDRAGLARIAFADEDGARP